MNKDEIQKMFETLINENLSACRKRQGRFGRIRHMKKALAYLDEKGWDTPADLIELYKARKTWNENGHAVYPVSVQLVVSSIIENALARTFIAVNYEKTMGEESHETE